MNGEKIVDKNKLEVLSLHLNNALKEVEKHTGLSLTLKNIRHGTNNATAKIEIATVAEDGHAVTEESEAFLMFCHLHGLDKSDLYREFTKTDGKKYCIIGYKPRASKKMFVIQDCRTGKRYVTNENFVLRGLGYPVMAKTGYEE